MYSEQEITEKTIELQNEKPIVLTTTKGHRMFHKGVEMTQTEIIKHFVAEAEKTEEKISKIKHILAVALKGQNTSTKFWIDAFANALGE
tara:strand:- start:239 stop:505 length:267 start_codon:yes stop_codon:yes gene_type:complete